MRAFDFDLTPLFRSTIGFDRLPRLMDAAMRVDESAQSYPPYNIEQLGEDRYTITMAVAGFGESDLDITVVDDVLIIAGKNGRDEGTRTYLHRGIAGRAFERRFTLADHIRVAGATLVNGLLNVDLVREVPEEKKPRAIKIQAGNGAKTIETKAA
jgi:molecular chaperone IbpA